MAMKSASSSNLDGRNGDASTAGAPYVIGDIGLVGVMTCEEGVDLLK